MKLAINVLRMTVIVMLVAAVASLFWVFLDVSEEYESRQYIQKTINTPLPDTKEMVRYTALSVVTYSGRFLVVAIGCQIFIYLLRRWQREQLGNGIKCQLGGKYPPPEPQKPIRQGTIEREALVDQHLFQVKARTEPRNFCN